MKDVEDIKNMKAKDVMEDFVVSNAFDVIWEVARDIIDNQSSEAIILDDNGNVVGIATLRDVVRAVANRISYDDPIEKIMTSNVITCKEDDSIDEVLIKLAKYNISRIPVLNNKNEIVGVVSEKTLLKIIPSLYEILEEEIALNEQKPVQEATLKEGICENCEQYSEELLEVDGRFLCKECYEEEQGSV